MTHPLVDPRGRWMRDVLSDEEVVERVRAGETELFELLMRRYNQQLFRAARAIVRDDDAAEEALQVAWVAAWRGLSTFAGRAKFSTWMRRIVVRVAGHAARRERRSEEIARDAWAAVPAGEREAEAADADPARSELAALLERAIDDLPELYRVVFVLRVVEGLPTAEVARVLDLEETTVKVRLHRARERLKKDLYRRAERAGSSTDVWAFDGGRCDRLVARVFAEAARPNAERSSALDVLDARAVEAIVAESSAGL